ncbi:hypothetical protein CB1_000350052 [Camelus ferus]|nr:hypothetical protein CB1_000350052 [Camelus ferus]
MDHISVTSARLFSTVQYVFTANLQELKAEDGNRGDFLANGHISKLCSWLHNFRVIPNTGGSYPSADCSLLSGCHHCGQPGAPAGAELGEALRGQGPSSGPPSAVLSDLGGVGDWKKQVETPPPAALSMPQRYGRTTQRSQYHACSTSYGRSVCICLRTGPDNFT